MPRPRHPSDAWRRAADAPSPPPRMRGLQAEAAQDVLDAARAGIRLAHKPGRHRVHLGLQLRVHCLPLRIRELGGARPPLREKVGQQGGVDGGRVHAVLVHKVQQRPRRLRLKHALVPHKHDVVRQRQRHPVVEVRLQAKVVAAPRDVRLQRAERPRGRLPPAGLAGLVGGVPARKVGRHRVQRVAEEVHPAPDSACRGRRGWPRAVPQAVRVCLQVGRQAAAVEEGH
mmetsp:Transcript_37887/g.95866  ORF Transcript_37887/g.95866 Transcript_37887/m.95866 type:complete len:228 (+) Transcript_37887:447-1130(+)